MQWTDREGISFIKGPLNAHISLTDTGWVWHVYNSDYTEVIAESPDVKYIPPDQFASVGSWVYIGEKTLEAAKLLCEMNMVED